MEKLKSIPALRFPGFKEEWSNNSLGGICSTFKSGNGITSKEIDEFGKYPVYGGNGLRGYTNSFTHDGTYILIGRQGALCGNITVTQGQSYISEHAIAVHTNDTSDNQWLAQKLKYMNLNQYSESSAQPGLAVNKLVKLKIKTPTLSEQQKIAAFLTTVDDKIQQLSKKKTLLEQYKKGLMQQLFSQQIRFKPDRASDGDEQGNEYPDWEEKKAKDIFKNHTNKNHDGDLPILAITQDQGAVLRDTIGIDIRSSEASVKSYKIVEVGDFIISLRSFQGGIEYSNVMGICSPAYTILKPKTELSTEFFKYYLKKESFIQQLSNSVIGIRDGKQISFDVFSGMKLPFPCIEEQTKIANFLSAIDNKINHVNRQLKQTRQYKQGLLQQMFV